MIFLLATAAGFLGCGAPSYAGMTRPETGQIVLTEAGGDGLNGVAIDRQVRNPSSVAVRSTSVEQPVWASHPRGSHDLQEAQLRLVGGEAALSVRSISSLKLRRQVSVQSLTCANQSMTGAGTTSCTVTLSSWAPRSGTTVSLSSNNAAVSVPASVTVSSGATTASFTAAVAAVTAAQTAGISASAGGATASFAINLVACKPALTVSSTNVPFGSVNVGQSATTSVTLTSSGNVPVSVSSISVAGSLFKATGVATPLTLNPGQSAALSLQFSPDHVSSFTGTVTIASNATQGATTISMSGNGVAAAVSGLLCNDASVTGSETNACSVTLNSTAPAGGVVVALSSNNAAVSVPASVTVAGGATSASFAAAVSGVTTAQTASITASANGSAKSFSIQLNAATPALAISSANVSFGSVAVGQTATNSVTLTSSGNAPLTISSISVAGSLFKATGVSTPLTLNPGQRATLSLQFYSDHTSSYTGIVTITSNAAPGSATINMSADGVPSLSGLTCNTASYSAAGTDSCLVSLYGAAPYTGFSITLASNNSSVTVPASVTVPSGAMSASFSATVSAVSSSQTASLTATASGITKSFAVQLAPASAVLTANATSVPFGSVLVNSPAEQTITLTSSGSSPVTISSLVVSGAGFTTSGMTAPLILNPGQSANLNVQFTPTSAGNFSGQLTIGSNATGGSISIPLSGTGYGHKVQLSWSAPVSGGAVGYNVYRALSGTTGYQRLNSTTVASTGYSDGNVQSGASYVYYVTTLDGTGQESVPSNTTAAAIPTP